MDAENNRYSKRLRCLLQRLLGLVFSLLIPAVMAGSEPFFTDVTRESGLDFIHFNGMSGEFYLPEIMGPGAALLDYDGDGDLDLFLVQGTMLGPGKSLGDARFPPPAGMPLGDRLFRNDLRVASDGKPLLRLTDVSEDAGIDGLDYGMGVATGDYDNDGWVDLYVTNFGRNRLLRNRAGVGFEDVTERAAVGDAAWSVSAAFLDYDRDGWLDLFVGNYVEQQLKNHKPCRAPSSALDYCTPMVHKDQPDRLYRNRGNGTFEDVSAKAGIHKTFGPALGVLVLDANGDGWPDIYVANDAKPNQLWINQRNGSFKDDAFFAGVAVNMEGAAEGSMGLAAGDFDADGDEDLFITHLTGETNTVYVNDGKGWFEDRSISTGLGGPSKAYTGFGTDWLDVDNDGWLDVFVSNGEVSIIRGLVAPAGPYPLGQPDRLYLNRKGKSFVDGSKQGGGYFERADIGRGVAVGDLDNDGDTDILVANNAGTARLLRNNIGSRGAWLGLDVRRKTGAPAIGARVQVRFTDGSSRWFSVRTDGSYASARDPRILVGLERGKKLKEVRVNWLNGMPETWTGLPRAQYSTLRHGEGSSAE
jgi:hypothetical protein